MGLFHSLLEGSEVYLVQSAVRNIDISRKAVYLLVVEYKVLEAACHTVGLGSLDVWHEYLACEVWVFAHIFESASVERSALYVTSRAEEDVFAAEGELFADGIAVGGGKIPVPCGSEACERWEGHDGVVGPSGRRPCVPLQLFSHSVRTVVHVELSDAKTWHTGAGELALCMKHFDFLVRSHSAKRIFYPVFHRCFGVQVNLCVTYCCSNGKC